MFTYRRLSGSGLGACDDVMTLGDSRKGILLNGCWDIIASKLDVSQHDWMETSILKLSDRLKTDCTLLNNVEGSNPCPS